MFCLTLILDELASSSLSSSAAQVSALRFRLSAVGRWRAPSGSTASTPPPWLREPRPASLARDEKAACEHKGPPLVSGLFSKHRTTGSVCRVLPFTVATICWLVSRHWTIRRDVSLATTDTSYRAMAPVGRVPEPLAAVKLSGASLASPGFDLDSRHVKKLLHVVDSFVINGRLRELHEV